MTSSANTFTYWSLLGLSPGSDSDQLKKAHIWTGAMGLALATGYFRLAADKHYMSDVITGAITGVLIGRFVQNKRSRDYLSVNLLEKEQSFELRIAFKVN